MQDISGLQRWLDRHGSRLEVLQLHAGYKDALTALPCCAKLQDLLLHGTRIQYHTEYVSVATRAWNDMASATTLTSLSLKYVQTASQQADVVAALTALPNLEQLTLVSVRCTPEQLMSGSLLLQRMTQLTSLELQGVTAAALQHLGSLTKLQHLSIDTYDSCRPAYRDEWHEAGCPGLQELRALTSLTLCSIQLVDLPANASQLTALQQLELHRASPTALNQLRVFDGLTQLCVRGVTDLSPESPPLRLPGLQHLELEEQYNSIFYRVTMPMAFLVSCTQLQFLKLKGYDFKGPGSLVASTMLQHLELVGCSIAAADGAADTASWRQVLPRAGQLPHLTSLQLPGEYPALQLQDMEGVVTCCSNLQVLGVDRSPSSFAPVLARLPGLTNLQLRYAFDEDFGAMPQLTGLKQLKVIGMWMLSAVGLRQLAALQQLTSLGFCGAHLSQPGKIYDVVTHHMNYNPPDGTYAVINKAPSGPPSDVSSQLLRMCDMADASEGLSDEAVIESLRAGRGEPSGSPGD